jgi:hypothetical protein
VHREFFMAAVEVLIKESSPAKGRKRWHHPEFGGFELRKDPAEIFEKVITVTRYLDAGRFYRGGPPAGLSLGVRCISVLSG